MALTQTSTNGIKDATIATADIAADAITGAKIADDAINSEHYTDGSIDTAHIADSQITTAKIADDAITGAKLSNNLDLPDDNRIRWGTGNDFEVWHSSNNNTYLKNSTGELKLASDNIALLTTDQSEKHIQCTGNGSVELYHDNTKHFETASDGANLYEATDKVIRFTGAISEIGSLTGFQTTNTAGDALVGFGIRASEIRLATGSAERLRIDSSGRVLIGTTTEGAATADELTIATDGSTGITIRSGTSGEGNIFFSDGTSGNDEYRGMIRYEHANNALVFKVDTAERLRIDSSGNVGIGTTAPTDYDGEADNLVIASSDHTGLTIASTGTDKRTNLYFADGTSGNAQYRGAFTYDHSDDFLLVRTAGDERLRIRSDGKINIGGALSGNHPPGDLNIVGTNFLTMTPNDNTNPSDNEVLGQISFLPYAAGTIAAASAKIEAVAEATQSGSANPSSLRFYTKPSTAGPGNSSSERMRINHSGHVTIGTTNDSNGGSANEPAGVVIRAEGQVICRRNDLMFTAKGIATGGYTAFRTMSAQTEVGNITFNSGGTAYNTSSDYRRKENVVNLTDGITRLKTLKPYRFNFKTEPSVTRDGFLAHEVTAVPEAVWGTKDAVEPEDNEDKGVKKDDPIYQTIDQSKLVPLLTAALQEAIAKIETLETKVAALEAA